MKKTLTLILALVLVVSALGMSAFAASPTASIKFTGKLTPEVVEPPTGMSSSIVFEDTAITGLVQTDIPRDSASPIYAVAAEDLTGIAVKKWDVKIAISEYTKVGEASVKILGAVTKLAANGLPTGVVTGSEPTMAPTLTLSPTGQSMFTSKAGSSSPGNWVGKWDPTLDVQPGTVLAVNYTAILTYTMEIDTP